MLVYVFNWPAKHMVQTGLVKVLAPDEASAQLLAFDEVRNWGNRDVALSEIQFVELLADPCVVQLVEPTY